VTISIAMPLMDLPPELLQLIFFYSSTPSFVQLIRTCHGVFDLAAQSREVIKRHLKNVPGDTHAIFNDKATTERLLLTLRRRAASSLQGVNITADRHDFLYSGVSINVSASCIAPVSSDHNIALVQEGGPFVRLYSASEGDLMLKRVLNPGSDDKTKYRPLQATFDEVNNFYVLYSMKEKSCACNSCTIDPPDQNVIERASLMRVRLSALSSPQNLWDIDQVIRKDVISNGTPVKPVAITAHGGNHVSIAWDSGTYINYAKYMYISRCTLFRGDPLLLTMTVRPNI
jgi:hypothetical protein